MRVGEGEAPVIGCVPYLNARPLVEGITLPIVELVPSLLFQMYKQGKLDAALLSSIDVISLPKAEVVDGISIASRGDVHSVILAYTGEIRAIETIILDPASHTSNALLQIILEEFFQMKPTYVQNTDSITSESPPLAPRLLIGDPAISFRKRTSNPKIHFLDLGREWFCKTGLPFVFAMWALKREFTKKEELSYLLFESKKLGLSQRSEIAARHSDPSFALHYMTELIRYDLGDEEKRGLDLFGKFLQKYNIPSTEIHSITYY